MIMILSFAGVSLSRTILSGLNKQTNKQKNKFLYYLIMWAIYFGISYPDLLLLLTFILKNNKQIYVCNFSICRRDNTVYSKILTSITMPIMLILLYCKY